MGLRRRTLWLSLICATSALPTSATGSIGTWSVTPNPEGARVSWTSPTPLPIVDAPVVIVQRDVGAVPGTVLSRDRRTVSAQLATAPTVDSLDVMRSGRALDEPRAAPPADDVDVPSEAARHTHAFGPDPALPGPYPIVASDVNAPRVKLPQMRTPVEMVAHIVEPTSDAPTGLRPVVLFLHGMHDWCTGRSSFRWPCRPGAEVQNHLGYRETQRVLASQGYFTISIRANGVNAQETLLDVGPRARASLIRAHLDRLVPLAAQHQLDLSRVILVGHSRGGEGVNMAATVIDATAPYRVAGLVHIGSVDFARQATPHMPMVALLPYCDGDVVTLEAQYYIDRARDLVDGDTALRSAVVIMGANHNFFNTEWTPGAPTGRDDWSGSGTQCRPGSSTRLSAARQRKVGTTYIAGAVRLFTRHDATVLGLFDGTGDRSPGIAFADVRTVGAGGDRLLIRPGIEARPAAGATATALLCQGVAGTRAPGLCGRFPLLEDGSRTPHWHDILNRAVSVRSWEVGWTAAGKRASLRMDQPVDLTGRRLDLRVIVDPLRGPATFRVSVGDSAGGLSSPVEVRLAPLPGRASDGLAKYMAQMVTIPSSQLAGIDLTAVTTITLEGRSPQGRVMVLDASGYVQAATPQTASVLPRLSIRRTRVREGDPPGRTRIQVPYSLSAPLATPGRFVLQWPRGDFFDARLEGATVEIPPGVTQGVAEATIFADNRHVGPLRFEMSAYALRGVLTERWAAWLDVDDDDPPSRLAVRAVSSPRAVVFRLSTATPSFGARTAIFRLHRGSAARALRVGDVSPAFVARYARSGARPSDPLYAVVGEVPVTLPIGATERAFVIPLRTGRSIPRPSTIGVTVWSTDGGVRRRAADVTASIPAGPIP